MDNKQLKDALKKEISTILGVNIDRISDSSSFESLGMDSLSLVELFVFIENNFDIQLMDSNISEKDLQDISSLADCILRNKS